MSNLKVSYEAIIDACAMLGVSRPVREIDLMLEGKIKLDPKVAEAIHAAHTAKIAAPVAEIEEKYNLDWNGLKWAHDKILELLKDRYLTHGQLCEELGLDSMSVSDLTGRLRKAKKTRSKGGHIDFRVFGLYHDDGINAVDTDSPRQKAIKNDDMTYSWAVHPKCGTTVKYTKSKVCFYCRNQSNADRYQQN